MATLSTLRTEYEQLFNNCVINPSKFNEINSIAQKILINKQKYLSIGNSLGIHWSFIGITHCLECNLDFTKHLHNGDPLTARTKHVPAGFPRTGQPPFTFENSAADALRLQNWINGPNGTSPACFLNLNLLMALVTGDQTFE